MMLFKKCNSIVFVFICLSRCISSTQSQILSPYSSNSHKRFYGTFRRPDSNNLWISNSKIALTTSRSTISSHSSSSFTTSPLSPVLLARNEYKTKKKRKVRNKNESDEPTENEFESELVPYEDGDEVEDLSLEEIRASLGPIGRTIASGVEVGFVTAGSYISGGMFGYFVGGVTGVKRLATQSSDAVKLRFGEEMKRRLADWNGNAIKQAGNWAKLSASFSGFHAFCRVLRGGKEDKWNGILGSAATGAFLSRKGKSNQ